ncbi:iron-containing redox enzyme family protein [Verminephrobacter eiseniae]|uniref:Iron-containing redox enzyme family protein n=1 Tax=Verminephrobacter eiseniae (strain EF01-2) TaxID=391735 RepID=A1WSB0_VEREI|nr:iron-containing redox enzyme family protein [Verminephrobacter eiseniae]ABM60517.1 hypothetical protein Veis_4825 [Verminephrobacter eiseniae EF01-2]MCW5285993.1 iron-containing redox enzyme family protein [Verminephrobacter eiseniae]MCW5304291.1 iron-containing redox enzyme family protein [Verminephrobacter eiseniae]MCW8180337.1 iron-containing redox enzyme family protein [Verminephrobacter eiseniae]MCW8192823.1 iron-containing redox enzyme family protein [Verminephrobacter eiseniae]
MLKTESIAADNPRLQVHDWPPVAAFEQFTPEVNAFLALPAEQQRQRLLALRGDHDSHGALINSCLGVIYAYVYGYKDSPVYLRADVELETRLLGAKLILEEEMIHVWLPPYDLPRFTDQRALADFLDDFIVNPQLNVGVYHEFWEYIRDEASYEGMREFLRLVLCRTEIVDDECALLLVGLQGNLKKVMCSNLWDECGNGALPRFHTYWLRRLLERTNDWEGLPEYRRSNQKPWSSGVLSNMFNVLLTRPGYKLRAYGCFLITESWVEPHFVRILDGLKRVGLDHDDVSVYFQTHVKIDPQHTAELIEALRHQTPALQPVEIDEIMHGVGLALSGAISQYRGVLAHLRAVDRRASIYPQLDLVTCD